MKCIANMFPFELHYIQKIFYFLKIEIKILCIHMRLTFHTIYTKPFNKTLTKHKHTLLRCKKFNVKEIVSMHLLWG